VRGLGTAYGPQLVQGRTLVGGPGGKSPPEALGILGITNIYLNDNFEPTTSFLSDQKNLILSDNYIFLSDYKNLK
jgi:hypothetical protein